jgi:hypothetical protein
MPQIEAGVLDLGNLASERARPEAPTKEFLGAAGFPLLEELPRHTPAARQAARLRQAIAQVACGRAPDRFEVGRRTPPGNP